MKHAKRITIDALASDYTAQVFKIDKRGPRWRDVAAAFMDGYKAGKRAGRADVRAKAGQAIEPKKGE